jgi:thiamine transport system permease protein
MRAAEFRVLMRNAASLLLILFFTAILFALLQAGWPPHQSLPWNYIVLITLWSLLQAALSTALSCCLGTFVALAIARGGWQDRWLTPALMAASVLPPTVAAFAVIAVLGRTSIFGGILELLGFQPQSWIFSLAGIVVAHLLLNVPLAARLMLERLRAIPNEQRRLVMALGLNWKQSLCLLEGPALLTVMPGIAQLVFFLCLTSFAVVQLLGGGPANATLEVAIYNALKVNVDFSQAAALILLQVGLMAVILMTWRPKPIMSQGIGQRVEVTNALPDARLVRTAGTAIALGALTLPCFALFSYVPAVPSLLNERVGTALVNSSLIALVTAILAALLGLLVSMTDWPQLRRFAGTVPVVFPVFGVSAGIYLLCRSFFDPFSWSLPIVALINAISALPFAMRFLEPAIERSEASYGRLGTMLALPRFWRFRHVIWPGAKRPALAAAALSAAFSFGDYGAIAFFSDGTIITLPLLMADRLGNYRLEEAGAIALLITGLAFLAAALSERAMRDA